MGHRLFVSVREIALRRALVDLFIREGWSVDCPASTGELFEGHPEGQADVVLLDWAAHEGLLSEENRPRLRQLDRQLPVVLLVPGSWLRYLTAGELGVTALLPKPLNAATAVQAVTEAATRTPGPSPTPAAV